MTTHTELAALPEIDYEALIAACYRETRYAQGTGGCVAFAKGAEWYREQCAAALESTERLAGGGEPVAWLYKTHAGDAQAFTNEPPPRLKELCLPLYTTPPPQAERVPLSDAEILALWSGSDVATRPVLGSKKVIVFARAIERAHGITPKEGT